MIQGQVAWRELVAAILASEVISDVDIFTAKADDPKITWANIGLQTHNAWNLKAASNRAHKDVVVLDNFNLPLKPEDDGALPAYDLHGLISGI